MQAEVPLVSPARFNGQQYLKKIERLPGSPSLFISLFAHVMTRNILRIRRHLESRIRNDELILAIFSCFQIMVCPYRYFPFYDATLPRYFFSTNPCMPLYSTIKKPFAPSLIAYTTLPSGIWQISLPLVDAVFLSVTLSLQLTTFI